MPTAGKKRKQEPGERGAPAARRPFSKLRWLGIVFVLPSVLYVTWVFGQLRAIEERNLRHLALAADSVEGSLRVAQRNVESLREAPSNADTFVARQPSLSLDDERDQDSLEVLGWLSEQPAERVEKVRTGYAGDSSGTFLLARFSVQRRTAVPRVDEAKQPQSRFERVEKAVERLAAAHGRPQPSEEPAQSKDGGPDTHFDALVVFRVATTDLLAEQALDSGVEHLLLISDQRSVLQQVSPIVPFGPRPAAHRVLEANQLEALERTPFGLGSDEEAGNAGDSADAKALVFGASSVRGVRLAGERYDLLCQPLRVERFVWRESADAPEASPWALCGLSSPRRALRQALSVAPHFALGLLLFLILGLLAWPFAKLALMHRLERLRFADAFMLLFTTFAALLILPLVLVDGDAYVGFRARQRTALEGLAAAVDAQLDEHLKSLYRELERFDRAVSEEGSKQAADRTFLFASADPPREEASESDASPMVPTYDHFVSIFWVDRDALQVVKMTTRDRNTPPVRLPYRDYVRAILDGEGWPVPRHWLPQEKEDDGERAPRSFFFQTYASATTGERSMALSIPSRFRPPGSDSGGDPPSVAAITSRPLWLVEPVLPPGINFAILDREGRALFHSIGHRALEENLLDELSNHRHLRSAMMARRAVHLGSRYRTRPHQIYVQPAGSCKWRPGERVGRDASGTALPSCTLETESRPIGAVPWWIVTLSDNEVAGAVNLESLGQTAVLAFWYAVALLLITVAAYVLTRRRGGAAFLWPDRRKRRLYRRSFWVSLVFVVAFGALIYWNTGERLQWAALLMPLAAALANVLLASPWLKLPDWLRGKMRASWEQIFRPHVSPQPGEISTTQLRWHLACIVVIWLLISVLPGIALFKAAWDDQSAALLKLEAVGLAENAVARARWLESEYAKTEFAETGELSREAVLNKRWDELSKVHQAASLFSSFIADGASSVSTEASHAQQGSSPLVELELADDLARYKPIYNRTVGGLRHLRDGAEARPGSYRWTLVGKGSVVRMVADARTAREVRSDWAGRPRLRTGAWGLLGGLVLAAALAFWVRWSALRIFFARIGSRIGERGYTLDQLREIDKPVIALVPSPTDRRLLVEEGDPEVVELAPGDPAEVERQIADLEVGGRRQVVCVNFAASLESPEPRQWKLRQLERLVYEKKRRVVVRAVVNPLEELFRETVEGEERLSTGKPIRLDPVEAQRWGRLLHEFVVYPITAKPPVMDLPLKRLFVQGLPKGLGRKHEERERRLEIFESYYWALWSSCNAEERLLLVQLVQENFLNPKQESNVRRLLQKGLMKREPRLQLMDEGFELFVRRIHEPVEIARWESSGAGMGWQQIRWGFVSLLAVVAIFLVATQQELVDVTLAFLSAMLVGGLPGLLEILSRLRRAGGRGLPR